eukprot:TRINITY_DN1657_c0_g1_i4.p3 TRINITY_DN1657_c0_g1~~TRINITY_DN1657_c0_g1_i4.p3  ORF type:complete len:109 (-),score=23.22 TRINITY_DN1657_c0_g1_i4:539-865(-)
MKEADRMLLRIDSAIVVQLKRVFNMSLKEQQGISTSGNKSVQRVSLVLARQSSAVGGKEGYYGDSFRVMKTLKRDNTIRRLKYGTYHSIKHVKVLNKHRKKNCRHWRN